MKVEQLFTFHRVNKKRKVPLIVLSFQGSAMIWWTAQEREQRVYGNPPIKY
ncbi:hypothetical protein Fmac_006018 [Flemingia macrophylla]|uniref:Uncharacterized protein n=1 Tax=Flemingia macrophylla TaxID=520843 RepID=A0ABD1NAV6_9FABA